MSFKKLLKLKEALPLVRKLKFHHLSQSKPHSTKCSSQYHKELARELDVVYRSIEALLEE